MSRMTNFIKEIKNNDFEFVSNGGDWIWSKDEVLYRLSNFNKWTLRNNIIFIKMLKSAL